MITLHMKYSNRYSIKILELNINGLTANKKELEQFLHAESIDIAKIGESHLTAGSYAKISNYNLYTANNPSRDSHGGAAFYVRNNLLQNEEQPYSTLHIQAVWATILLHCGKFIKIAAVYSPPAHKIARGKYL